MTRARMYRVQTVLAMLVAIGLAAPAAMADTILGTAGNGFQSWTTGVLNQSAPPYWDNGSLDGANFNIGYCLTGTGGCQAPGPHLASPPGALPYWGTASGGADPKVYFQSSGSSSSAVQLTIAGNAGTNIFGWFETDATGTLLGATHPLFTGASAGASAAFTPTGFYGFYFSAPAVSGSPTWYSLSGLNGANDPNLQHFAIFQGAGSSFWVAAEDLPFRSSDKDFNDLIVTLTPTPTPTPEPGSLVLMGSGLVLTGCALRRRLRRRYGTD